MAFITRTRIVQFADLVGGVQTVLATPTVFRTGANGVVTQTMAQAMALVPAGSRPPEDEWWKYLLQWEVQSHAIPNFRGVITNTGRLVFDVDFWETSADRLAGQQPKRRNTFIHEFTAKRLAGAAQEIRAEIDDYLLRAEFNNYPIDGRDPRIQTTSNPVNDPLKLMNRQAINDLDDQPIDLAARWRGQ